MKTLIISNWENRGDNIPEILTSMGKENYFLKIYQGEKIGNLNEYDSIILSGAPIFVNQEDNYSFLKDEFKLVKDSIEKKIPLLGICFGAQVIAHALGGKIKKSGTPEIGWCNVELTNEGLTHPMFNNVTEQFKTFQYHYEEIELDGVKHLAKSETTKMQAFSTNNDLVWAIQFHPEVGLEKADEIFTPDHLKSLKEKNVPIVLSKQGVNVELKELIFKNFIEFVRRRKQ